MFVFEFTDRIEYVNALERKHTTSLSVFDTLDKNTGGDPGRYRERIFQDYNDK